MEGLSLDEDRFQAIAKLPGREVLIGQFAGLVASPLTGLVRGLGSLIQGLALQLGQIAEQGLVSGEAPATEEPKAEEPAAAETVEEAQAEEPAAEVAQAEDAAVEGGADGPSEDTTSNDDASKEEE